MELQGYNMPDDLYYEEHHYWVRVEGDLLVMGMDDFAQQLAGQIVYGLFSAVGSLRLRVVSACDCDRRLGGLSTFQQPAPHHHSSGGYGYECSISEFSKGLDRLRRLLEG